MTLTATRLREVLDYNPEDRSFVRKLSGKSRDIIGKRRWATNPGGYTSIMIDGKLYYAHRLAWLWMTGEWPLSHIDHVNGDGADNQWRNLRSATRGQNLSNRGVQINNSSGFKGVSFIRASGRYSSKIWCENKRYWLGTFDTKEEAHEAYVKKAMVLHGEFARTT